MIAFLFANRWAAELLGVIVLLTAGFGWLKVQDATEFKAGETRCEAQLTETKGQYEEQQGRIAQAYDAHILEAQQEHDRQLADLRLGRDPIVMHDGALCPSPVHNPPAASGEHPASGGPSAGIGRDTDIRPAINAFELKYETALAGCRQVLADWPH